ncbi:DUF3261 domain-containing protein [Acinetobacter larvae]|uniref:DUF3261 domain-containing protein n=1 Tax=Acinetobacter larvae TaxID=1789224 RepID=A0A1B2M257_9GAMM|nr:DUF3261 domain-containing protein [Acinetobacter larvae]AOA59286.1 DUF3261 domain-containing protein [Acinetobacter larvae]
MRRLIAISLLCTGVIFTGCQALIPAAPGLINPQWQAMQYQRQDQVEVQWKDKSFSFLLYQTQQASQLELLALSLTGQVLFQLQYDGQQVKVIQRIDAMKLLPFDFVVRDILFATYPQFATATIADVEMQQQEQQRVIYIKQQPVLNIQVQEDGIDVYNQQVPYQMHFSAVENTLEDLPKDAS